MRCGHCLHVFNAAAQIVPVNVTSENILQAIDKVDALIQQAPDFINTGEFTNKNLENNAHEILFFFQFPYKYNTVKITFKITNS